MLKILPNVTIDDPSSGYRLTLVTRPILDESKYDVIQLFARGVFHCGRFREKLTVNTCVLHARDMEELEGILEKIGSNYRINHSKDHQLAFADGLIGLIKLGQSPTGIAYLKDVQFHSEKLLVCAFIQADFYREI